MERLYSKFSSKAKEMVKPLQVFLCTSISSSELCPPLIPGECIFPKSTSASLQHLMHSIHPQEGWLLGVVHWGRIMYYSSTLFPLGTELPSEKPNSTALQGSDAAGAQGPGKEASTAVITDVHICRILELSLCKLIWL